MLWSIGRDGKQHAAFAYETVLAIFHVSDLIPTRIHLSVPRKFRRAVVPKILSLHQEDRDPEDVIDYEGLRVVKPLISIIDMIREERVSPEHIEKGFKDSIRKGIITNLTIDAADISPRERRLFQTWIKDARGSR